MLGKSLALLLALIVLLSLATAAKAQQDISCPANDPPWGKELVEPDHIRPTGGVLDASLVVRKKRDCIPTWSSNLCKGTFLRCTSPNSTDGQCTAATPCANAKTCLGTAPAKSCTKDADCTTGPQKCVRAWGWDKVDLRTYGFPINANQPFDPSNPNDPNLKWDRPGPTLHGRTEILRDPSLPKSPSNPTLTPGTRVKVALYNYLDPQNYLDKDKCDPAGPNYTPEFPQCFHGSELTNLHYHGTHVSPQPHQDFVLLELWPFGSTNVPDSPDTSSPKLGKYQTDINPLPWNQTPGTQWYHPHKHGATALQVLNGMSGALLVDGPFDDWLNNFYKGQGQLTERLLILQQVQKELDFFEKGVQDFPPQVLVNSMATPKIFMRPGEIQRFRFVGATVEASAALEIGFDQRIKAIRQIAQDGIQFAWQNYDRQPYRDSEGGFNSFKLGPGNRADFLVQAPDQPGIYMIEHNVVVEGLKAKVQELHRTDQSVLERVPDMAESVLMSIQGGPTVSSAPVDPQNGTPLLFLIEVLQEQAKPMTFPVTQGTDPACAAASPPVRCWPKTPSFLADLPVPNTLAREIDFSMKGATGDPPSFYINRTQYDHHCAGASMARHATEDWKVGNVKFTPGSSDALLPHPFHIHVNPFQTIRNGDRNFEPPYVWQDTIQLPVIDQIVPVKVPNGQPIKDQADADARCPTICGTSTGRGELHSIWTKVWDSNSCSCQKVTSRPAGPIWNNDDAKVKCPRSCAADNSTWNGNWRTTIANVLSECDCEMRSDSVLVRQRFDDYTGAYVIHCHFLGHEDRGMMWNVQTTCAAPKPWTFGQPLADGGPDNCNQESREKPFACCPDENGKYTCGPR